jgi:molybdopterin-guanine dinucleotide biosynthesis protein A
VVQDRYDVRASIVGIHAALAATGGSVIVLGWDTPLVPVSLIHRIRELGSDGVHSVVPIGLRGPEACVAFYSILALPIVERLIRERNYSLTALQRALPRVIQLPPAEVALHGDPSLSFANVNTPEDLDALTLLAGHGL